MNKYLKKIIFPVITIIFVFVVIEILSFSFFNLFKDRFSFFDINQYLLTDSFIKYARASYHFERGWDTHYDTQLGERPRQISYHKPYISTFGDSFTHCDQVGHHETWQEYLSLMLKKDVYNFGTGGYGTDQAYMKFLAKFQRTKTPIVILGLRTENINRVVNVYRPFYYLKTGLRLTKPRFIIQNNKLVFLKNPINTEKELVKLKSPKFLMDIGHNDFWYNRGDYPVLSFPYSKILFNKHMWAELIYTAKGHQIDDSNPRPYVNVWEDKKAADIMFKLFESFIEKARKEEAIPLIMVIPTKYEVAMKLATGKYTENTIKIMEFCRVNNFRYFNPIDGFVKYVKKGNAIADFYRIHIGPKGNQIIANELFQYLRENISSE